MLPLSFNTPIFNTNTQPKLLALIFGLILTACSAPKIDVNPQYKTNQPYKTNRPYKTNNHHTVNTRPASPNTPNYYIVQRGDTLSKIAMRYGLDYRQIGALNRLDSNYTIKVGQRLLLSTPIGAPMNAPKPPKRQITYDRPTTHNSPVAPTMPTYTQPTYATSNKWLMPVNGRLLRGYDKNSGMRGVWYTAKHGTPVVASKEGAVVYVGSGLPEYGNLIMIKHSDDYISAYAHLGNFSVKEKQVVQAGQQIGTVGHMPGINQPAIEFQIRYGGLPINPINLLQ
ncbi:peptidase M23B [Moraxella macacae 0408225]|uniref:Peptidase M23B n=1 Tax=Moraxella macacae 0408225 TaxID=1230338 RepID=L2F6F2_9GAMM|nr:peptidoglycan DD-metalloendopeptidase family protein [Moraxella macacae]ELA08634.1 peptidase M23B [Moraxella macacae 0408225]